MTDKNINIVFQPKPSALNFNDIDGQQFGQLRVIGFAGIKTRAQWFCICICGNTIRKTASLLMRGKIKSCGCLRNKSKGCRPEYSIYLAAKNRCNNSKSRDFHNYGMRGIKFRFNSFEEFLDEIGKRPNNTYSLERINNNGHYEKGNVKWATIVEQSRNKRRNRNITIDGITRCVKDWADISGLHRSVVYARLNRGWCAKCAVFLPFEHHCFHM